MQPHSHEERLYTGHIVSAEEVRKELGLSASEDQILANLLKLRGLALLYLAKYIIAKIVPAESVTYKRCWIIMIHWAARRGPGRP